MKHLMFFTEQWQRCALYMLLVLVLSGQSLIAQTWIQKQDFPSIEGGDGSVVFAIGHKIYVGGGFGSKKFYEYDIVANTWVQKADLPGVTDSRCFGTGFTVNGKGYMGLGLDISPVFAATCKKDMWEYDPSTDTWLQKSSFPGIACDGHFSFVIDGVAYIGGGEQFHGPSQRQFYAFDPITDTWTPKADYPDTQGTTSPFAFTSGSNGYVSCGMVTDGDAVTETNTTYSYNTLTDQWTRKADFIGAARQAGVSFVANSRIYCGWGLQVKNNGIFYNDFYEYNPYADNWVKSFESSVPARGFASALSTENGSVYLGLGWQSGTVFYDWHELQFQVTGVDQDIATESLNPNVNTRQAGDYIFVSGQGEMFSFRIYSCTGELIVSGESTGNRIDVRHLRTGLYAVQIISRASIMSGLFVR